MNNKFSRRNARFTLISALGFILMCILTTAFAQNAVYKWTGEDGVVHYGASPPMGVEAELIKAGSKGNINQPSDSGQANSENPANEDAAPAVELSPEMLARKQARCKEERERLAALNKPGRLRMNLPDGSTRYMSVEEISSEIAITEQVIKESCN